MELEKKKRNDILLIGILLLIVLCLLFIQNMFGKKGAEVMVIQDGELLYEFSLDEEMYGKSAFCIISEEGYNTLEIRNGEATIIEADCPDGLCVKQKAISKQGESLICLPHQLVITVEGADAPGIDAMTY